MPIHWTYAEVTPDANLQQGDILVPNEALSSLFRSYHPHFLESKYLAFMVITQSCDLELRNNTCSARHVSVAIVRSLSQVLPELLGTVCTPIQETLFSTGDKYRATQLLERIFNQNEQKFGLFYLYPDGDVGIGEDAVVFLRISVAFRVEHYEALRSARTGRLAPTFANKLGWLAGNLYSRIGTQDWPKKDRQRMVDQYLGDDNCLDVQWLDPNVARTFQSLRKDHPSAPQLDLIARAEVEARHPKDDGLDRILQIIAAELGPLDKSAAIDLRAALSIDSALDATFRK